MRGAVLMRAAVVIGIVLVAAAASARVKVRNDVSFKVIVHPSNPVTRVDRDRLRNMFLKKVVVWSGRDTIRPIDLSAKLAARDVFTRKVLRKTPAQLKAYWNQQIFSGKGVPPPQAERVEDAIAYVLAHRGAIGYLPPDADPGGAKVIEVE